MRLTLQRCAYFFALVDRDEMAECGPYDRALFYASFIRQIIGVSFVFIVFLFAWVSVLPLWMAFLLAAVSSLIVLFLDQAIIGSEWTLHKEFNSTSIFGDGASFVFKLWKLLPRIAYAVFVALVIATLAELALQSRAIDRVLQEETKASNKAYFDKKDALRQVQVDKLKALDAEIGSLGTAIKNKQDPSGVNTLNELQSNQKETSSSIILLNQQLSKLEKEKRDTENRQRDLETKVKAAQNQIETDVQQKYLELNSPDRCRNPGSEVCKKSRWQDFNKDQIAAETELSNAKPELDSINSRLEAIHNQVIDINKDLGTRNSNLTSLNEKISALTTDTRSVDVLVDAQKFKIDERSALIGTQTTESQNLNDELIKGGYFSTADYDPLDRYVGLNKLYEDKEKGEAAKRFSLGLKIFIVLFELSPVLVMVFFTPFSFYAQKMRAKRDTALVDGIEARLNVLSKIDEARTRAYEAKLKEKLKREEAYKAYRSKKEEKTWGWWFNWRAKYQEQRKRIFEMRKANNIAEDIHEQFRKTGRDRRGKRNE